MNIYVKRNSKLSCLLHISSEDFNHIVLFFFSSFNKELIMYLKYKS